MLFVSCPIRRVCLALSQQARLLGLGGATQRPSRVRLGLALFALSSPSVPSRENNRYPSRQRVQRHRSSPSNPSSSLVPLKVP